MRVQFTVDKNEWEKLKSLVSDAGYPDIPSYCKDASLGKRTYGEMWKTVERKIKEMKSGNEFSLNDLVDAPPANLGVKLYNNQGELGIEKTGKTNGSNRFRKI